jgi:uncharacterized protein involved in outer membrane biogenesis
LIVLPVLTLALLSSIDRGWLDRPLARWASHKLGRTVRFEALETHLLSSRRSITVRGLTISGPSWAGDRNLVRIARFSARMELLPLFFGQARMPDILIEEPRVQLIRLRDGRNNWTLNRNSPGEPAFAALRGTQMLRISGGVFSLDDQTRGLRFAGTFAQEPGTRLPFSLHGQGTLQTGGLALTARGGPLQGASAGRSYPFVARLVDGGLIMRARGTSGQPFDFSRYNLAIASQGPNLADFAYLFSLQAPNSAPFSLTVRAQADGPMVSFSDLSGHTGNSDFAGWIRSDQRTRRHKVTADLRSKRWTRQDVEAWLSPLPSRAFARSTSGRMAVEPAGSWILSNEAFPVDQLRAVDLESGIEVSSLEGYSLPLRSVRAHVRLNHGRLLISKLRARMYGGSVSGGVQLNVAGRRPLLGVSAAVRGLDLGRIRTPASMRLGGRLNLQMHLRGGGESIHTAAAAATGKASMRITAGILPPPAAFLLGGDIIRAVGTFGKGKSAVTMSCARASFGGSHGKFLVRDLAIRTAEGMTVGHGTLDLGTEQINLRLDGQPTERRLFQVALPVLVQGSLSRPSVTLLPHSNARKLGLKGKLGVALSPIVALLPLGRGPQVTADCD